MNPSLLNKTNLNYQSCNFQNKKIDLYKLKNYGKIDMEVTSMHPSSPNYRKPRKEDYKPRYTRTPSYW